MRIKLENITKSYKGKQVLTVVSAEIPESGIFGIFGPSGCGKTTLLRIICGLEKPDSGVITGTENIKFSVVFQEDRLLEGFTALQNVEAVSDKKTAVDWLKKVELGEDADKTVSLMSGGMQRRVALARAFAFEADALILDEPFKGIEQELKESIGKLICEYAQDKLVIIVTHDEYGASLAKASIKLV